MKAYAMQAQTRTNRGMRDRLIAEHMEIARRISLRMARRCPDWIAPDDLVAAGMLGLTEAAARYDETRTEPFLSFAEKRIRGAVLDELRRGDIMPRRARAMARKIGQTIQALEKELAAPPSDEQIAARLGVSLETYLEDLEGLIHLTVGALDPSDEPAATDDGSPETEAHRRHALSRIRPALEKLERRDLLVLNLYYKEELTYGEIAQVLGVTGSRVCQIHGRAIARLRAELMGPNGDAGEEKSS
jgi:RNA polymerase sigma factor for flagellar operon FliA